MNDSGEIPEQPEAEAEHADLRRAWVALIIVGVVVGGIALVVGSPRGSTRPLAPPTFPIGAVGTVTEPVDPDLPGAFSVAPPPFQTPEVLDSLQETGKPCSSCHNPEDLPPDPRRRKLDAHEMIVLKHDEKHRWCLDCHDADNRDMLRLASGTLVPFSESYRLCGQCHGDKYRDWRLGIHGRRTGMWNGKKQYLLCVACHWAHAPHFKPLKPKPAPKHPGEIGG